jgi:8-hydroxy-5-deazaflavin:NADPH oxidoreductase
MKIGIVGSGDVGRTLGAGFATRGHDVKLGTRTPGKEAVSAWAAKSGPRTSVGTFADAAAFGDLVVVATRWDGTENALKLALPSNLNGKVVIDATNPLTMKDGELGLALGYTESGGEQVQRWLPGARVVKAFNTVGALHMCDPGFSGGPPDMFLAGDDPSAKKVVAELASSLGWGVVDLGPLRRARLLEPFAMVWIQHAIDTKTRDHAFKLLRK